MSVLVSLGTVKRYRSLQVAAFQKGKKDSLETLIRIGSCESLRFEVTQFNIAGGQTQNPAVITNWGASPLRHEFQ